MNRLASPSLAAAFALLSACAALQPAAHTPNMSEAEVVALANDSAEAAGVNLTKFHPPEAHFEYVSKDNTWAVFYIGTAKTIGNHFLVVIDDKTRKTQIVPGL